KIDFYGKNKPIFKKIDQWFFLLQFKEIRDCQVVAFGGFRELKDEKGQIRLFDYEKMKYISKNIPVEYLYDISLSYKFIVYLWDGDLKIKSLAEYLK
ncbi:MAG: hypothetical protein LWY06_19345, partial [Firmicutes bacterium]|nr:hypothetical protein [Bacillota bacterium]